MTLLKFIISIIIVLITTYIGFSKSKKLRYREYILRDTVTFLELVKNEINYNMNILSNAYEVSRQKLNTSLKDAIGQIVADMLTQNSIEKIDFSIVNNIGNYDRIVNIVDNISRLSELTDYDKNVIISIFRNLGRSDIDSQINIINNGIYTLENQIKEANDIKLTNEKMYRNMGALVGLMIVVIFI